MIRVTYQKNNGDILYRLRSTSLDYKIGQTTSMGWKVLNIEYEYDNKYYPLNEYNALIKRKIEAYIKRKQIREQYMMNFRTIIFYLIALLIINLFEKMLGM